MQVLLHRIPRKYLERLNEPDKGHIETALKGLEIEFSFQRLLETCTGTGKPGRNRND